MLANLPLLKVLPDPLLLVTGLGNAWRHEDSTLLVIYLQAVMKKTKLATYK